MINPSLPEYRKDEISLSELIESGTIYFRAIRRSWLLLLISGIVVAGASAFYFANQPAVYQARLSFMLDEEGGSQMAGMNGILGQLGIPIIGSRINISKLLELSKSRKIVQEALFVEVQINNKTDYLANHIIEEYELDTKWENYDEGLKGFRFVSADQSTFGPLENYVVKRICDLVAGTPANRKNAFLETDYGQNTTIMSFVVETTNELISYHLTREIFNATSKFYVESSIEKHQNTFDVLTEKRDSVQQMYDKFEKQFVVLSDRSQGLFTNQNTVKRERVRAEMIQIGSAIAKVEENLAIVEFAIENSTPVLQVIDAPLLPLNELKVSIRKAIFLGFSGGVLIGLIIVLFRTFIEISRAGD